MKKRSSNDNMSTRSVLCLSLIIATVFMAVCFLSIYRINPDGQPGGDALQYISLTRGKIDSVPSPFRFRIAVPLLAALIHISPYHSLIIITYCSMIALFVVVIYTSYKLNRDIVASVLGVLLIFSSRWFLYNFQNPYLTDAFALAAIGVSVSALVSLAFPVFAFFVVLGLLARETVIPFSLAWAITWRWKQTLLVILLSSLAYIIPRLMIPADVPVMRYFVTEIQRDGILADPREFVFQFALSWGYIFLLAIPGFMFFPRLHMSRLLVALAVLFVTAVGSCLVAVDFGRMFEILGPVFALSCAQVIHTLRTRSGMATSICVAWLLLVFIQSFAVVPNVFLPEEPSTLLKWGKESVGLLLTLVTYIAIVRSPKTQLWPAATGPGR